MATLLSLLPILIPLLGALFLLPTRGYRRARPLISLAVLLLTLIVLGINTRLPDTSNFLFGQLSLVPDVDLRFDYNSVTLLFSALALVAAVAWLLIENLTTKTRWGAASLVSLAGAIALICADNWSTLIAGWVLADLGLLAWRLEASDAPSGVLAWRAFGISLFGALGVSAGAFFQLAAGASLRIPDATLDGWAATLILFAAWVRSGLFPFQVPMAQRLAQLPGLDSVQTSSQPGRGHGLHPSALIGPGMGKRFGDDLYGIALGVLMGLYLLTRSQLVLLGPAPSGLVPSGNIALSELLVILALFGLGATALLALLQPNRDAQLAWACWAAGAAVWVIPFMPVLNVHSALAVWLALGLWHMVVALLGARLLCAQTLRQPWRQVLWGLAILCAVGFPLTPGFFGRIGLYAVVLNGGGLPYLVLLPITLTFALVPLWRAFFDVRGEQERTPTVVEYIGLALLILPPLIEGIVPFAIMSLFGPGVEDASAFAYDALLHAPNFWQPIILVLAVIFPLPLAFILARYFSRWEGRLVAPARPALAVLDLSLITRLGVRIMDTLMTGVRELSALIEQHPVGWFLFAALWVALWLLNLH
ncbi:MAG: hypothetical protein WCF84_22880 [Anaerolineae bacterium]